MADEVANLLLRFRGEAKDVKGEIDDVIEHLRALGESDATSEVEVKGIDSSIANLEKLRAALALIPDDKTIKVSAKTDLPSAAVAEFGRALSGVDKDVQRRGGIFGAIGGAVETFGRNLRGARGEVDETTGSVGRLGRLFERLGTSLATTERSTGRSTNTLLRFGTEAIQVFSGTTDASLASISALASLGVVVAVLAAALAALAASAGLAVGGLLAIGTALGGIIVPAGILAVGVFQSFGKVLEVLKAKQQASQQAAIKEAQGHAAAKVAAEQRQAAEQALADALESLTQARVQALQEEQDAALRAASAILALDRARLSRQEAKLGIQDAELALKEFREQIGLTGEDYKKLFDQFSDVEFDPSKLTGALNKFVPGANEDDQNKLLHLVFNLKDARLREKEAIQGVKGATVDLDRAEAKHQDFLKRGIFASDQYRAALKRVQTARENLTKAETDPAMLSGMAKVQALTEDLTGAQKRLLDAIEGIEDAFKRAFGPAINSVIDGIASGFERLPDLIDKLAGPFSRLGKGVGAGISGLFEVLTSLESVAAFRTFTDTAAKLSGPIGKAMGRFLLILIRIGTVALPALLTVLGKVFDFFDRTFSKTENAQKLNDIIDLLVDNFLTWATVFAQFGNLFIAFLQAAGPAGQDLAKWLGEIAQHLADWLNSEEGRQRVQQFFDDTLPLVKSLAGFFGKFTLLLLNIGQVASGPLKVIVDGVNLLLDVVNKVFGAFGGLAHFLRNTVKDAFVYLLLGPAGPILLIKKVIDGINGRLGKFFGGLPKRFATVGKAVGDAFSSAFRKALELIQGIITDIIDAYNAIPGHKDVKNPFIRQIKPFKQPIIPIVDKAPIHQKFHDSIAHTSSLRAAPLASTAGGPAIGTNIEKADIILPEPTGGGVFDPKHAATSFFEEMRRRGGI